MTRIALVSRNSWVIFPRPNPLARWRLFCLPYAGGGASAFYNWPLDLPNYVEVCSVQLPGRENRMSERPFTHFLPLIQSLTKAVWPLLDKPFAFFGHSMGAILGFELARQLRKLNEPEPIHLFASGSRAPQIPESRPTYHLPEVELLEA